VWDPVEVHSLLEEAGVKLIVGGNLNDINDLDGSAYLYLYYYDPYYYDPYVSC